MKPQLSLLFALFVITTATAQSVPVKTDSIVLDNAVLYYHRYGSGTPIVILSGGPGLGAFQESDVAEQLGKNYQAVLFEQRGTGRSWTKPMDKTTINLTTAIDDLDQLRKRLGVDRLNLYGHSWGATLSLAYAAAHPDQVGLLVLAGHAELDRTYYDVVEVTMEQRRAPFADSLRYWSDSVNVQRDPQKATEERRRINRYPYIYDRSQVDRYGLQISKGVLNQTTFGLMWQSLAQQIGQGPGLGKTVQAYKGPVLAVFGWQDPMAVPTLYPLTQALPQTEVRGINRCGHMASRTAGPWCRASGSCINRCGHMASIEQPEKFFGLVNDFLGRHLASAKSR